MCERRNQNDLVREHPFMPAAEMRMFARLLATVLLSLPVILLSAVIVAAAFGS